MWIATEGSLTALAWGGGASRRSRTGLARRLYSESVGQSASPPSPHSTHVRLSRRTRGGEAEGLSSVRTARRTHYSNTTSPSLPPLREQPRRSTEGPFAEVARESARILASSAEGWCWASYGARPAGRRPLCHIIYFTPRGVEANEIQSQLLADLRPSAHSSVCPSSLARLAITSQSPPAHHALATMFRTDV